MGSPESAISFTGVIRYIEPDSSVTADQLSLFGFAKPQRVVDKKVAIHDVRKAAGITRGPPGLDVQGFTYIEHHSKLCNEAHPEGGRWFDGHSLENEYIPEVYELAKKVLGADRVVALNCVVRRAHVETQKDPYLTELKGCDFDRMAASLPKDIIHVAGRDLDGTKGVEPIRTAHVDFSLQGMRDTVRYCREDITALANDALSAEDMSESTGNRVPRYAAYSVWRPLRPVKRDCLAVLDARTLLPSEVQPVQIRHLSSINPSGEYISESLCLLPPTDASRQEWYTMPDQQPHEVLFIKLADSSAAKGSGIASGCGHCSPEMPGKDHEEMRSSVEVRVLAFWD